MLRLVHRPFAALSQSSGGSPDELKLIFSFLLSYPLAGLLKRVPDARPYRKNLFIIGTSVFYLVGLFDLWRGLLTITISAGGAYLIAKYMRKSPYMPWIGFIFVMSHMAVSHIRRQAANTPSTIDISGAQMVLVMKLSAFCWNVADGQLSDDLLSDLQRDRAIKKLPSLLDYAGYILFFPSLFAGPAFDYAEYRRWIDTSMFDIPSCVDPSKKPPSRKKRRIPRSGTPATFKALTGLFWIALFGFLSAKYGQEQLLLDSYMQHALWRRIWIMYVVNLVARLKYYGVWTLTEGSCILAGLGYNGFDPVTGKVFWDRLQNIDPWAVETAQNPRGYLAGWNMNTNNWLRNYVYLRVTARGKSPGFQASLMTFVTSALWHGFYPGYYLTFILASLIQTAAKNFRRIVRPFFLDAVSGEPTPRKKYYDITSFIVTQLTFSFATTPFLLLNLADSVRAWSRVYFYGAAWTLASLIFFASPGKLALKAALEKLQGRATGSKLVQSMSPNSLSGKEPILGISKEPDQDMSEAMGELKAEVGARHREKSD
ncbi:uncharacterized protein UV8b_06351 [Ustilaginoidea virens]|uniref:MBOAT family protein n=1 Tax=Ustilaginoidea virens TaxID=1159556 RepID=A0A8E5HVE4_USTVR|nr:uncharacterized protein UV8b_06351 [Ustilaginoidea virens]QUC22110.1 hypothetical protein UV8b_06351 [Ustilaginoidea virens]